MNDFFAQIGLGSRKHVTDGELLGFMDGEIRSGNARRIRFHLEACWTCRRRYEQIQSTIFEFMDYRNQMAARYMPPPSGGKARFLVELQNEIGKPRPSWCARIFSRAHTKAVASLNPVLSLCLVLAAVALVILLAGHDPKTVSAAELLNKAESSEMHFAENGRHVLVSQRVRLSSPTTAFDRLLYRDSEGRRHARQTQLNQAGVELKRRLEVAGVDWQKPLSAADFQRWHDHLSDKQDTVSIDDKTITLLTSTSSSPVTQASLTVRKIDC